MSDDLVERVALAICEDAGMACHCRIACAVCKVDARAAIALVLEEAAKVCDPKGDCSEMDAYGKAYAASIRAMLNRKRKNEM